MYVCMYVYTYMSLCKYEAIKSTFSGQFTRVCVIYRIASVF